MRVRMSIILTAALVVSALAPMTSLELTQSGERVLVIGVNYSDYRNDLWSFSFVEDGMSHIIMPLIYAGLYRYNGTMEPDLALTYPVQLNDSAYIVRLRDGLFFSDGTALTADDVVFSITAMSSRTYTFSNTFQTGSRLSEATDSLQGTALNDTAVLVTLSSPGFDWITLMDFPVIPRAKYEQSFSACVDNGTQCPSSDRTGFFTTGAGPFVMTTFSTSQDLTFEANPYYHGQVALDRVVVRNYPSIADAESAYLAGEVDVLEPLFFDPYSSLTANQTAAVTKSHKEIALNNLHPVFGTGEATPVGTANSSLAVEAARHVRRAFSLVVDRGAVSSMYPSGATPITLPLPALPSVVSDPPDSYNVTRAKEHMEAAGYNYSDLQAPDQDGYYSTFFFNITVLVPSTVPTRVEWGLLWAKELQRIGVGASVVSTGWENIIPRTIGHSIPVPTYDNGGYDTFLLEYVWNRFPLPSNFIYPDMYNYDDPEFSSLYSNYTSNSDPVETWRLREEMFSQLHWDLPAIGVVSENQIVLNRNVQGLDGTLYVLGSLDWSSIDIDEPQTATTSTDTGVTSSTGTSSTDTGVTSSTGTSSTDTGVTSSTGTSSTTTGDLSSSGTTDSSTNASSPVSNTEGSSTSPLPVDAWLVLVAVFSTGASAAVRRRARGDHS